MSGVAANAKAQEMLRLREEDRARRAASDLRAVMSAPAGRRFVWGLIDVVMDASFSGEQPNTTAFNEGRRAAGVELLQRAQRDASDLYVQALQEALAERAADAALRAAAAAEATQETDR